MAVTNILSLGNLRLWSLRDFGLLGGFRNLGAFSSIVNKIYIYILDNLSF